MLQLEGFAVHVGLCANIGKYCNGVEKLKAEFMSVMLSVFAATVKVRLCGLANCLSVIW